MKYLLMIWNAISDKHTVSICLLCAFSILAGGAWLAFVPKVWFGSTASEAYHNHVERVPVFNMVTNDAQTKMIVANRDHSEHEVEFKALLFGLERHKDRQLDALDSAGNFKSDRHRTIWMDQGKDLDQRMKELKEKMKGNKKSFYSDLMIAKRQK